VYKLLIEEQAVISYQVPAVAAATHHER